MSEFGYSPCCVYKGSIPAGSPEQYWSSEQLALLRQKMFSKTLPDSCVVCKKNIEKNLDSDLEIWNRRFNDNPVDITNIKYPLVFDFRPGNHCNLKCRMCGPDSSDQIEKENTNNPHLASFYSKHNKGSFDIERALEYIRDKKFKSIKVLGGEPSIDQKVIEFIEHLSPDVRLEITTNATSINSKYINVLKKFHDLHLTFSVDAVGKTYEYIRTNANWDIVANNIDKMLSIDIARTYKFNVVLMPYNLFNLPDLVRWFRSLRDKRYKFTVWYTNSDSERTSLTNVKDHHKEEVIDLLFATKDNEAYKLIEILSSISYEGDKGFVKFNNALDNVRNTKLIDLDIRFKDYI